MREISVERERAAEATIKAIPDVLKATSPCTISYTSDKKLSELGKTGELLLAEPDRYKYAIKDTSVIKMANIKPISTSTSEAAPLQIIEGDLYQVCRMFNNATVICDINAIVPGGGFRIGDDSNEAQLCRYSTLYTSLDTKIAKMRYYYLNTPQGRWAQDSVVVVPDVIFFSDIFTEPISRHTVLGFSPPNMSVTSTQLKLSPRTNESFTKRVNSTFDLALALSREGLNNETIILPIFGYKTFNLPVRLCATVLVDALSRVAQMSVATIILVVDEENKTILDEMLPRLSNIVYREI